ncbi:YfmQ family protein [Peribacillus sp. SCS-155]|uniref:YfmQ family protein n=1 Tax=Peribacillus sedimenti TaxID=3115297 RepID=UPI003906A8F1
MTWTVVISIAIAVAFKFFMSPPSAVVAWYLSKFALHPKLSSKDVTVTCNGKHLEEEEKIRFIDSFNEAAFIEEYWIYPGNEKLFLHPDTKVAPFIISVKRGKNVVHFFVFSYDDHVDVVKQYKEKVVSYSLRSDYLQKFTVAADTKSSAI